MGEREPVCGCPFGTFLFFVVLVSALVAAGIVLAILIPVLIYKEGGDSMGKAINNCQISFVRVTFSNARPDVITARNVIALYGGGGYDVTLKPANMDMYYNGTLVAKITVPEIFIPAYQPITIIDFTNDLYLQNLDTLQKMAYLAVSQEAVITVRLVGYIDTVVKILGGSHHFNHIWFDKTAPLPQLVLSELLVGDAAKFDGSQSGQLTFQGTTNFTNEAPISALSLGDFLMEIYALPENILIGTALQPAFSLIEGDNNNVAIVTARQTPTNMAVVDRFFSNYAMGRSQYVMMRGPINNNTIPQYLIHSIERQVKVLGTTAGPLLINSTIPGAKGVAHYARNPLDTSINMVNVTGLAYTSLRVAFQNTAPPINCSFGTNLLARLVTGDPTTGAENRNQRIPIGPAGVSRIPMVPVVNASDPALPSQVCGVNRLVLLTCLHLDHPISTYLTASFVLEIGNFTVNVNYTQNYLSLQLILPVAAVKLILCANPVGTDIVLSNDPPLVSSG